MNEFAQALLSITLKQRHAERHLRECVVARWVRCTPTISSYKAFLEMAERENEPLAMLDLKVKGRG